MQPKQISVTHWVKQWSIQLPPGMEAGFAQLVMATAALPPEDKDTHVVQFMNESGGGELGNSCTAKP